MSDFTLISIANFNPPHSLYLKVTTFKLYQKGVFIPTDNYEQIIIFSEFRIMFIIELSNFKNIH